ncbi:HEPN domain-containing protein [Paraburkholderia sp. IMGN_8]|uniref:HEPN domain-containing protein n=1 Tax=Paraburkholderia sp. IMGN_8 TaxID=3136564 RepID=UPI0031019584
MKNQEMSRQLQRLDSLFKRAAEASNGDFDLQSHWARYLCVLVSGFVENGVKEIYSEYVSHGASKPVADYAIAHLSTIQNPKAEKILTIAGSFKKEWREELEKYLEDDGRKDAIDSIMANRHQIAHGKDVGITLVRIHEFFKKIVDIFKLIEQQCGA